MKFNLVNDDKLQIIITKDDLASRNLHRWDLAPHNPVAQKLFQEILEEAHTECGFEVGMDAQLMVEAYPMTGESMLITVTKLRDNQSSKGFPFDMNLESIGQALMHEMGQEQEDDDPKPILEGLNEMVFEFDELEHVIALSRPLMTFYVGPVQLLRYKDKYYLSLQVADNLIGRGYALLMEYGRFDARPGSFFREFGEIIIAEDAIEILSEI